MRYVEITDVLALSPPPGLDAASAEFAATVEDIARRSVRAQWAPGHAPGLSFQMIEQHVTTDPGQVDVIQPAGHCRNCQVGNAMTKDYLVRNPDRPVVLVSIRYVEEWPS